LSCRPDKESKDRKVKQWKEGKKERKESKKVWRTEETNLLSHGREGHETLIIKALKNLSYF
jgi:hypothetical protein